MISVVLTTYNRLEKLVRAIDSVIYQTFPDWQLVIVDDASTDGTPEYLKDLAERNPKVKVVQRGENFGTHTRPKNEGIQVADGEYIAFLDDDNAYRKDHLQALWKALESSGADVVYGDRMITWEDGSKKPMPGIKSDFRLGLLAQQNYIDTSDVLLKKSLLESVGGWDESLEYFADWNLWVRLAKMGYTFERVPLVLTDYYVHQTNNLVVKAPKEINFSPQDCLLWPEKTLFGPAPELKVAIYSLTHDRLGYTIQTFTSMRDEAGYPFDHFVVDNASEDDTLAWLTEALKGNAITDFRSYDQNLGISQGSNAALEMIEAHGKYDIIMKVDNDCLFLTPDWLKRLVEVFKRSRLAVVSPYVEGLIDHPGGSPRLHDGWIGEEYVGMVAHLGGISVAAPASAYEGFRWPTEDFLHGEQDLVFSQVCIAKGMQLFYLENVKVEHIDSTAGQQDKFPEYFKRRKIERVTKYHGKS